MIPNGLPEYLSRKLKCDGLISARWVGRDQLQLRVRAHVPWERPDGGRERTSMASVQVALTGGRPSFRLVYPDARRALHPDWDVSGQWREAKERALVYRNDAELAELLRRMIADLDSAPETAARHRNPAIVRGRPHGRPTPARRAAAEDDTLCMHARALIWRTGRLETLVKFPDHCPLCMSGQEHISEVERRGQWWWSCGACGNEWDPVGAN